jgi:hypothetical protein
MPKTWLTPIVSSDVLSAEVAHEGAKDTSEASAERSEGHVRDTPDDDAAGERRALDLPGVDLVVEVHLDKNGRDDGGRQRQVGVDDGAGHGRLRVGRGRVEGREVDEHEERAEHRQAVLEVGRLVVAVALVLVAPAGEADETHGEAEVRAEREDLDGPANIGDAEAVHAAFVEGVEDDFKQGHRQELRNRDAPENCAKRDEASCSGEVGFNQRSDVERRRCNSSSGRGREQAAAENREEGGERANN